MDYQKKLEGLITTLTSEGGSDLHLGVSRTPAIRVFGELIFLAKHPVLSKEDMLGIMSVILDKSKIEKFMENQELDFAYNFREHNRFRGNAFFQKGLISIVLRLIPPVQKLADLNLPSMVNVINGEQARNIITIEDPIEHMHIPEKSIISQREVGIDTKDFSTALKYVFREDVNVIMIGEMRNPETVSAAVTAAETGHLVLSTLHTNNASQ